MSSGQLVRRIALVLLCTGVLEQAVAKWERVQTIAASQHAQKAISSVGLPLGEGAAKDQGFKLEEDAAEEDERNGHVTEVVKVLAVCLFGSLIMNFSMLYLVNIRDADVRRYIYTMISTTISIFCAVMLNQAVNSFFLKQVLVAPFPRGLHLELGVKERFFVFFLILSGNFCLINFLCFKLRAAKEYLYAVATIGGHLCAFAGIFMFGELQQCPGVRNNWWMCAGVLVLSFVFLSCYRRVSRFVRSKLVDAERLSLSAYQTLHQSQLHGKEQDEPAWEEHVADAEDEAGVLIESYLMTQCMCFLLVGRLPNIEREYHHYGEKEVGLLLCAAFVFIILLLLITSVRITRRTGHWTKRCVTTLQSFISLSFGWCLQTVGEWQFLLWLQDAYLAAVLEAFAMTAASVMLILLFDRVADWVHDKGLDNDGSPLPSRSLTSRVVSRMSLSSETPDTTRRRQLTRLVGISVASLEDWLYWERALRTIIHGFGLLVGLSWDKAFDVAELGIVQGFDNFFARRPVISRIGLAVSLVSFILPAWIWYIVPLAQMTDAEIRAVVTAEIERDAQRLTEIDEGGQEAE